MDLKEFSRQRRFGATSPVWLIFSLFYFIPLIWMDSTELKLMSVLAYTGFVGLYLWLCRIPHRQAWLPIITITLYSIFTADINPMSVVFLQYVAIYCCTFYRIKHSLGLLVGFCGVSLYIGINHMPYFFQFFIIPLTAITGLIERKRLLSEMELVVSQSESLQLATIAERERIARDLHDIIGHHMASISLKAELAEKFLQRNAVEEAALHLRELQQISRESSKLIRETVSGYKHKGLKGELIILKNRLAQKHIAFTVEGEFPPLVPTTETTLILILTELVTNILKHSDATRCTLNIVTKHDELCVTLSENGTSQEFRDGYGLQGIAQRLEAIGGHYSVSFTPTPCTTVRLPLDRAH